MKSNKIIKDALALFIITLISGLFLGFVYEITKEPIAEQKAIAKQRAYKEVFPEASEFVVDEEFSKAAKEEEFVDKFEKEGYAGITIDEVNKANDSKGEKIGSVMTVTTKNGYGSGITLTFGMKMDGSITGIEFLSISETAGLGMKAKEPAFKDQFMGKQAESFIVTKTGSQNDNEIDAISGATITSNAVTQAVNAGIYFSTNCIVNTTTN